MIDLRQYYLENIRKEDYYYRYYELIDKVNYSLNPWTEEYEEQNYQFEVYDVKEAIEKFRELCQPNNEPSTDESKCWFYLVCFYLDKHGYIIEQFPNLLKRPPKEPADFTYNEIRNKAFSLGWNRGNTIPYEIRRKIVSDLKFQVAGNIDPGESLNEKFVEISTRGAKFQEMSPDEKLAEIANLIENMLKVNGEFISLDYSKVAGDFLSDEIVKKYRKQMQCFRHASDEAVAQRAAYSKEQKDFLIDFGIVICKTINELKKR